MKRRLYAALAVLAVAAGAMACGEESEPSEVPTTTGAPRVTSTTTTTPSTVTSSTTAPTPISITSTTARPSLASSSRLRIDGVGPIDVGMTVAQARAVAGTELSLRKEPYCDIVTAPRGPAGLDLVITDPASERIDLIIVRDGQVATVSGIRLGSTEAEVLATYPGRIRTVNPALPAHRLIYTAADPTLVDRVLVFVIERGRVATMYAGVPNQAEADEICG